MLKTRKNCTRVSSKLCDGDVMSAEFRWNFAAVESCEGSCWQLLHKKVVLDVVQRNHWQQWTEIIFP